ncbi:haloacid dehalogenase type II [Nostoc sp. FACHB-87]|uniref:haloacid dehalogenase type II n=1 Tax=Nostocaceae TaxID=1162 RepID=UPI0016820DB8|nr:MULTISPECIES: haloacid dehalogenase type II [Nostocaceae]MBD2453140.1 haloacid dehalogenase type II [Nostoc sp. FACHB-87]MBD2475081.1 haloacid dehalogenase type II [Anabaena sp. FACHB-83]
MKDHNEEPKLYDGKFRKLKNSMLKSGMTRRSALGLLSSGGLALITGASTVAAGRVAQASRGRNPQQITTLVFDAYGTLFDVFLPVFNRAKEIYGPAYNDLLYETLIQVWRLKQLEYSWLRTLINRYEDFYSCTVSALDFALRSVGIDPESDPAKRDALASRYLTLDAYPEALEVLNTLKSRGFQLAILSNGSREMLQQVVVANNMQNVLDRWISVDEVGVFKPDPRVYSLAGRELGIPRKQILFVSSNSFDVFGAKSYGLQTAWIRRNTTLPQVATPIPSTVSPSTLFGILRGRQEFQEETSLLPDYVVLPPSATPTQGLRGLLTLPPLV